MKIKLDEWAQMPTRSHEWDGGLDLYSPKSVWLWPCRQEFIDTGVHMSIPPGCVGLVKSRSGMMKKGVTTDGTIDSGYTGSIGVMLFNHSRGDVYIQQGDRIAQVVILPCVIPMLEEVDQLEDTERGDSGFGSTGR